MKNRKRKDEEGRKDWHKRLRGSWYIECQPLNAGRKEKVAGVCRAKKREGRGETCVKFEINHEKKTKENEALKAGLIRSCPEKSVGHCRGFSGDQCNKRKEGQTKKPEGWTPCRKNETKGNRIKRI